MSNHLMSSFDVAVLQCNSRKCCNQTEIPASLLFWIENYVWCSDYINEKLKLNIQISQDSVVTHLRRGGGRWRISCFFCSSSLNAKVKELLQSVHIDKVIIRRKVASFYGWTTLHSFSATYIVLMHILHLLEIHYYCIQLHTHYIYGLYSTCSDVLFLTVTKNMHICRKCWK